MSINKISLLLFFSVFLMMINSLKAQSLKEQINIEKGKTFKSDFHTAIFPTPSGDFFAFEPITKKKVNLIYMNEKLEKVRENKIKFKLEGGKHDYEGAFYLNDKLYVLSSNEDNSTKLNQLFIRTINQKTLEFNEDERVISAINYEGNWKTNSGSFEIIISNDKSKLAIFNKEPGKRKEPINYSLTVLDTKNDLKVLWSRSFTTEKVKKEINLANAIISNQGEAAFLFSGGFKNNSGSSYSFKIQYLDKDGRNEVEFPVTTKTGFISYLQFGFNNNNSIVAAGFYSDKLTLKDGLNIKGSYYLLIDKVTKKIIKENYKEFEMNFITDFMKERKVKKAKKRKSKGKDYGLSNYVLDDLVFRSDGGVILIAEEYYVTSYTTRNSQGISSTTYTHNYNTIIAVSIAPSGEIEWARKIPKRQRFQTKDYSNNSKIKSYVSYSLFVHNNKLYFFYIDNPKNLVAKDYGEMKGWKIKKSVVVAVEINSEGFMNKAGILDSKEDKTVLLPTNIKKDASGKIIGFAKWKNKGRYYRFEIEE